MRHLDFTFDRPSLNLAFDEVLLESVEKARADDTLWFWESPAPFVVLGVSQALAKEVNEDACREACVPVYRRCSAGGCVLQGPGCLNYSLVLTHEKCADIKTIRSSYCYILGRICSALRKRGIAASHMGISDLAVDDMKFSGNAQRRRKCGILHHGTLLYNYDLPFIGRLLQEPEDRPEYRGCREHLGFVRNIPLLASDLKTAIREAFAVTETVDSPLDEELARTVELAEQKYESMEWIHRR